MRPKLRLLQSSYRPNPECKAKDSGIGAKGSDKSVPKPSVEVEDSLSIRPKGYVGIAALARYLGISKSSIYDLIKSDPTFPYKNVGLKKKYVVDIDESEQWLSARTKKQKDEAFKIPTGAELLGRYKK